MSPESRASLSLDYPFDLRRSLTALMMGGGDPTQRLEPGQYWKATRTPQGPATLHLAQTGASTVDVEAWGAGSGWLMSRVPALLGAHDRPDALHAPEGLVRKLHREHRGLRLVRAPWPFEVLVQVILQQRVSSAQAFGGYRAIVRGHGEAAPGPAELSLPVAPRTLAYLPSDVFMRASIDHQRAETLRAASLVYRRIDELIDRDLADVRGRLSHVRGVGPWTVESTLLFAFGDPDAVPLGDYNLPNTVAWALAEEPRAGDARMIELLEPYRGQRGRVITLIEAAGLHAPRYGPRLRLPGPPRGRQDRGPR